MLLALSSTQKLGIGLMAAAFVVFALISAMLIPRYRPDFPARHMGWFIAACVVFTLGMLATIAFVAKETEHEASAETHVTETEPSEPPPAEPLLRRRRVPPAVMPPARWSSRRTAGVATRCPTPGTTGTIGPNLDDLKPPYDVIVEQVTNGGGAMPPFGGTLTEQQIADVAAYVSAVAGT